MRKICAGLWCSLLLMLAVSADAQSNTCLELRSGNPDRIVGAIPVDAGSIIRLEFVNSLYQAPVRETLTYNENEGISIIMVESTSIGVFENYGLTPDDTGRSLMKRVVGDFIIRSDDYVNHRIIVNDRVILLKGLVMDGESLVVKVNINGKCGP